MQIKAAAPYHVLTVSRLLTNCPATCAELNSNRNSHHLRRKKCARLLPNNILRSTSPQERPKAVTQSHNQPIPQWVFLTWIYRHCCASHHKTRFARLELYPWGWDQRKHGLPKVPSMRQSGHFAGRNTPRSEPVVWICGHKKKNTRSAFFFCMLRSG